MTGRARNANPDRCGLPAGHTAGRQGTLRRGRSARSRRFSIHRRAGRGWVLPLESRTGGARWPDVCPPSSCWTLRGGSPSRLFPEQGVL